MITTKKVLLGLVLIGGLQTTHSADAAEAVVQGVFSATANAAASSLANAGVKAIEKGALVVAGGAAVGATVFTRHYLFGSDYKSTIRKLEAEVANLQAEIEKLNTVVIVNKDKTIVDLKNHITQLTEYQNLQAQALELATNTDKYDEHAKTLAAQQDELITFLKRSIAEIQETAAKEIAERKLAEKRAQLAEADVIAMMATMDNLMQSLGFKVNPDGIVTQFNPETREDEMVTFETPSADAAGTKE